MHSRRQFLRLCGLMALAGPAHGLPFSLRNGINNPCLAAGLPSELQQHPLLRSAWQGIDPQRLWDAHVHISGIGDDDADLWINPKLQSVWHLSDHLRYHFFLNAYCASDKADVNASIQHRLHALAEAMPAGFHCVLLALDYAHDDAGRRKRALSSFYVADRVVRNLAQRWPDRFAWAASIHPYRHDAVERLHAAAEQGAVAVKWLPPSMNINPADRRCRPFYRALQQLNMPLLSHAGDEQAAMGTNTQYLGNPLLLRHALDDGVRVLVAHCGSLGKGTDLDNGKKVRNFDLFLRLLTAYPKHCYGGLSALTQLNRKPRFLRRLLQHPEWHRQLFYGSDYPVPGVFPLYDMQSLHKAGLLNGQQARLLDRIRPHNALLFHFLLLRWVADQGRGFAPICFDSKRLLRTA